MTGMTVGARGGKPHNRGSWLYTLPYAVFFLTFIAYPLGFAIYMSLHEWGLISGDRPWVGLGNFLTLFQDPLFLTSLVNTFVYLAVNLPLTLVCGIALAVALNASFPGRTFFRTVYFLPYVTSTVVVALLWKWMLSTDDGMLNGFLKVLGFDGLPWLTSTWLAMPTIAVVVTWKSLGFYVLLFLGGLQTIPRSLEEAAVTDGATWWQRFRHVTLPGLRPAIALVIALSTITGFQVFAEPYLMTGGGPLNSTMTPVLYLYQKGFQSLDFGYAAAIGIVVALVVVAVVLLQRRFLEERTT
ncbi:carbohydrate ABC transporter permease [Nonomuraea solani]|nr:sugar ABC transporter permease [Nonomuraea solani]